VHASSGGHTTRSARCPGPRDAARADHARPAERSATDLTDDEYALVAPHLPAPDRLGRPREVDPREVLDAIPYLLRTGCPWRLLPEEFPPRSTAFDYPGTRGFAVLPRRRVVERTLAWLGRHRMNRGPQPRFIARDLETTIASAITMAGLASLQLLVRRLASA
jgi:transposase